MRTLAFYVVAAFILVFPVSISAFAEDGPKIILQSSFIDSEGRTNVVGTVRNFGAMPAEVIVGIQTNDGRTLEAPTFGRTVWPLSDSPFKFILEPGTSQSGAPFIVQAKKVQSTHYDMLVLSYDGMAVGEEKAFVGKIRSTAPFDIYNVSVFAAVHSSDHKFQLDTVRSNIIPVIRPGEEVEFVAIPDSTVRHDVLYYSCAGLDFDAPITTLEAGEGKFIPYDLTAFAEVSRFRYENTTDSIAFGIRPYNPDGGPLSIKIPQLRANQTVSVLVDGSVHQASVRGDGKTIFIDFYVPKGEHDVQIQGVRNVPELPYALLALSAVTATAVGLARFCKGAFKISKDIQT